MTRLCLATVIMGIASLAGSAFAQAAEAPQATTQPAQTIRPVMDLVPAGAMGFFTVNNINQSAAAAEKFMVAAGLSELLSMPPESGWLVSMIKTQAILDEGFNPKGGFAVVMLDPQQFGIDIGAMMGISTPAEDATAQPAPKLPVVVLVPGAGIAETFGRYPMDQEGEFHIIAFRMGPMLATQIGDYIAISPSSEALKAVRDSEKKVTCEIAPAQLAEIAGSHFAMHLNMKVAGPLASGLLKQLESKMDEQAMPGMQNMPADMVKFYTAFYGDLLMQLNSVTATGQFADSGLVIGETVSIDPASDWGKALAEYKPSGGKLLDRLPNLPYVLAYGGSWEGTPDTVKKLAGKMFGKFFGMDLMSSLGEETKQAIIDLTNKSYDLDTGFQIALGGAPAESGLLGMAILSESKDSQADKAILSKIPAICEDLLRALLKQSPDIESLKVTYVEQAESLAGQGVDAIDITHPKLQELDEKELADMQKLLGESRIRIRVLPVDDKSLAITIGGGQAMLAEAQKAATKGGTILADEGTAEALKYMPDKPMVLMLFSGHNLAKLITRGSKVMKPESKPLELKMASKTPIAAAVNISGSDMSARFYLPSSFIKDAIATFNSITSRMMAPPPSSPEGSTPAQ